MAWDKVDDDGGWISTGSQSPQAVAQELCLANARVTTDNKLPVRALLTEVLLDGIIQLDIHRPDVKTRAKVSLAPPVHIVRQIDIFSLISMFR
jgi:hypothetical protein